MSDQGPGDSPTSKVEAGATQAVGRVRIGWFIQAVLLVSVLAAGYAVYEFVKQQANEVANIIPEIGAPLECPPGTNGLAICFENCPVGWTFDQIGTCYQPCPSDWQGTSTLTHCQHKDIYSTVGADPSLSIPNQCSGGKVNRFGFCYNLPSGWDVTAPGFIGKICPPGTRDDGTSCWRDLHTYGRSAGYFSESSCVSNENTACEQDPLLWYPKCRPGYRAAGCCLCERPIEVTSKSVQSQIGTLPDECPADRELVGRLCYPRCPAGFERYRDNVEFCSSTCPSGFNRIGIGGCQKPTLHLAGKGILEVGVCPKNKPKRVGDLCFRSDDSDP